MFWNTSKELWCMVWNFLLMKRNHNCLASVMQIGQETLTLEDQHQAMFFRLEVAQSVGHARSKQHLPSPLLKLNMLLWVQRFNGRSWKTNGCPACYLRRQPRSHWTNAKYHNRTKHIDICHHFVRERVVSNEIQVISCPTGDMIADIITKGLLQNLPLRNWEIN